MAGGNLAGAANDDLGSGGDQGAGDGGLFADGAAAGDVDFKPGGVGLLDDLARRQAEQRRNLELTGVADHDLIGWGLLWRSC